MTKFVLSLCLVLVLPRAAAAQSAPIFVAPTVTTEAIPPCSAP